MNLRVIIFQEGESWSAQCVDYDIGARGNSVGEVQKRIINQLIVEARYSAEATGEMFGGIAAAPKYFRGEWSAGTLGFSAIIDLKDDYVASRP